MARSLCFFAQVRCTRLTIAILVAAPASAYLSNLTPQVTRWLCYCRATTLYPISTPANVTTMNVLPRIAYPISTNVTMQGACLSRLQLDLQFQHRECYRYAYVSELHRAHYHLR